MRMVLHCGALAFKKIKIKGHQFLEVSDGDHIDRLLSCLYIALPLFKRGASNSKFINYLIKHIIPVFDMFPEERKGDLLKNLAKCSHHVAPQECRQLLPSVVQLLKVQNSLSYAVRTGRLSDSHGREVSIGNTVFVTTSRSMEGNKNFSSTKETSNYSEENILGAKGWPIQLLMGFDLGDNVITQNSGVLNITRNGSSSPVFMNKRKLITTDGTLRQHQTLEVAKRAHTTSEMSLI